MTALAVTGLVLLFAASALAQPASGTGDAGRQVFMKNGCHGCHTIGAMGTPIGPDLSRVGGRQARPWFERWLRDPASLRPRAHMQALELTERDLQALADYLATLK